MDRGRPDLIERGRQAAAWLLSPEGRLAAAREEVAILLSGSAATEFADDHSGIDLVVLGADGSWEAVGRGLFDGVPPAPGEARPLAGAGPRVKAAVWPVGRVRELAERWDDGILYLLANSRVLHDPAGLASPLLEAAGRVPEEAWEAKAALAYRHFRQRKAALAWALRRGQPFVCLDNLIQVLMAALSLCYYLEGKPPPHRKWLFRGALRTPLGQALRPPLFELLTSLGDIALLGGSFSLRHNRLYGLLTRVQGQLEAELARRGWERGAGGRGPAREARAAL